MVTAATLKPALAGKNNPCNHSAFGFLFHLAFEIVTRMVEESQRLLQINCPPETDDPELLPMSCAVMVGVLLPPQVLNRPVTVTPLTVMNWALRITGKQRSRKSEVNFCILPVDGVQEFTFTGSHQVEWYFFFGEMLQQVIAIAQAVAGR